jgi:proteasome component ECM29
VPPFSGDPCSENTPEPSSFHCRHPHPPSPGLQTSDFRPDRETGVSVTEPKTENRKPKTERGGCGDKLTLGDKHERVELEDLVLLFYPDLVTTFAFQERFACVIDSVSADRSTHKGILEMSTFNQDLQLIQKVELRFALADTNEKFQSALNVYLAPLLLKFASNDKQAKLQLGKTIKFLLSKFNSTPELKLPAEALLEQVKNPNLKLDQDPTVVQSYTLLFLSKSIPRLTEKEQLELFPKLLSSINNFKDSVAARLFNISCKILDSLANDAENLASLSELFHSLEVADREYLLVKYYKFMLLHTASTDANGQIPSNLSQPGLSQKDCSFFFYYAGVTFNSATLASYKMNIMKLIEPVSDLGNAKALVFLCASTDGDSKTSSYASTCLKRIPVDYEDDAFIKTIATLFVGEKNQFQPVKSQLQEKILSIMCKSKAATQNEAIEEISSIGLNSSNVRLKQTTVSFVRWFTTMSTLANNNSQAVEKIGKQLKLNLSDISMDRTSPNYLDNRRYQYETLGLLLKKSNGLLNVPYIQFLIDMMLTDDRDLLSTIQDALLGLTNNLTSLDETQRIKLKEMLVALYEKSNDVSPEDTMNQVRYIAIKFINSLYPFNDPEARTIDILARSKHDRIETIEEAKKGLSPYQFEINNIYENGPIKSSNRNLIFPSFHLMVKCILKYKDFVNMEVAIEFTFRCLIMNSIKDKNTVIACDQYWETRVDKAFEIDPVVKSSVIETLHDMRDIEGDQLEDFASSSLNTFIELAFYYVLKSNSLTVLITLTKLVSLCDERVTNFLTTHIPSLLNNELEVLSNESYHYVSQLIGIICSTPSVPDSEVIEVLNKLIVKRNVSSAGFLISRLCLRSRSDIVTSDLFDEVLKLVESKMNDASSRSLKMSLDAVSQLAMFGCLGPNLALSPNVDAFKARIINKIKPLVEKCYESAISAWSYLALSYPHDENLSDEEPHLNEFESVLFETYSTKQIDNLFMTGEAFAILCDGWLSAKMKDSNDVCGSKNPSGLNPNRCAVILGKVLQSCKTTKPSLRRAACVWLLSIVQYSSDAVIIERISDIQASFMRFLSDREEIIQEAASRGLSITYEKGRPEVQSDLVHNLLKSFTDSNKTSKELMSGYVDEETQLFDSGVLNTGNGESVSTYKDVLNLASEVGNPSLVYKFMSLAKNSALWSSKKGIAFGLGAILDKEKLDKLLSENPSLSERLIPKLFRYKYDPSPSISRTMNDIWNSLIANNKKTLDANFESVEKELLNGMGNREWRTREASTSALQDLLRQCDFAKFENDLEKIWMMAFRTMDDIKSSVRKAGSSLTRFLANTMVLKLNSTSNKDTQASILKQLVPFFLGDNGLLSDSEDVKKFAFETIMKLISTSSKSLKPFVAEIVSQMVLLMTSVEPQVINYLTLNADKYNLKVEDIDSQRLGIVGSSPMMEAIEKLMDLLDENNISDFIGKFAASVKSAIGLPSKVAGSKIIVNLILRHFFIVSNKGNELLKIAQGQIKDRNETVAKSYAIACGYCIRIASVKKIESFGRKLTKYYFEKKEDNNGDDKMPKISSIACEAISNFANDQFQSNAALFLPLAFIGKHDLNEEIAKNFGRVWSDSTSSSVNAIKLYFPEILTLIKQHIQTQTFSLRKTIALSIIEIIDTLDTRLTELNPTHLNELYSLLLESLIGRVYEGKEKLLDSLVKLSCKSAKFLAANDELYGKVEERVLTEAKRNNKAYKIHSILALGNFLNTFHEDPELYSKYIELIDSMINKGDADSDDEMDDKDSKMDVDRVTTVKQITSTENALLNVIHALSNGEKCNIEVLHYAIDQSIDYVKFTTVDELPNSDSKFKYKQGIMKILLRLIELNKNDIIGGLEKEWLNSKLFEFWSLVKGVTGSSDNVQSVLVSFTRCTGALLNDVELTEEQKNTCIMCLKLLRSDNVNSVITIECDKIIGKYN